GLCGFARTATIAPPDMYGKTKRGEACENSGYGCRQTVRLAPDTDYQPINKGIGLRTGPSRKGSVHPLLLDADIARRRETSKAGGRRASHIRPYMSYSAP